jgi:hypothetical protein
MSVPTGSDASTAAEESNDQQPDESAVETVRQWASHWRAWAVAALSLAVVAWAAFLQPQASPKGYIPIFLGFAALAVGFVYLDEETQIEFASS